MPQIYAATVPDRPKNPGGAHSVTTGRKGLFASILAFSTAAIIAVLLLGFYNVKAYVIHANLASRFRWEGDSFVASDAELGYVPRPNAAVHFRLPLDYEVYTDSRGGRVAGPGQTSPEKIDVLSVGCSFAWGHGVNEPDTYAHLLQNRTGLKVYNIAVASYGTTTTLLYMKRFADMRPKVIVYGFIDDHLARNIRPTAASICPYIRPVPFVDFDEQGSPKIHPPIGDTSLHDQYLHDIVFDHTFGLKDISWAMYTDYLRVGRWQSDPFLGVSDPHALKKIRNYDKWIADPVKLQKMLNFLVAEMTAEAKRNHAKLIIAYLPTRNLASASLYLVKAVEAAHDSETLFLVDTSPALRKLAEGGIDAVFLPGDSHPGPHGHAAIAEAIAPLVRKLAEADR